MVRKVIGSLGSLLADAQEQGLSAHNAVRELKRNRRRGKESHAEKRQKGKLKVGVDIPKPEEIKAIIANAKGRWRPLLITAVFTGLRASELRGLRWTDVNLRANEITSVSALTDMLTDIMRLANPSQPLASGWFPSESLSPIP
jgi:integrase